MATVFFAMYGPMCDPDEGGDTTAVCGSSKRQEPLNDSGEGSPTKGLVTIHKRRRLYSSEVEDSKAKSGEPPSTPDKKIQVSEPTTPEEVSLPIIYYGARTHKQIQQVVREFSRTEYCGKALMTVLSSREYSCIREFDRKQWATKNDMGQTAKETGNQLTARTITTARH
ncbi:unnamed protein product [Leptidea sinapis]|uniref:RAD3-like helicase DEAD domain-containing protein n=1 Tax=Leptidea sinapis TaxID=189913 RepID=A0A5E4Q4E5_9NEOP|nr:unnamed protein product [Leptidea sinapis]